MNSAGDATLAGIHAEWDAFVGGFASVMLATADAGGNCEASYAPVLRHDGCLYIYVSELAVHTRNLLTGTGSASLLFIEDEASCRNIFARRRSSIQVTATEVARDAEHWLAIMEQMEQRFGNMMQLLRTLSDFHLLQLTPAEGSYTAGFGKAYRLSGEGLSHIEHLQRR